jgi:hypothetical protein
MQEEAGGWQRWLSDRPEFAKTLSVAEGIWTY